MSTSCNVSVMFGCAIEADALVKKTPNPDYDPKHPFSSVTGERIPETLVTVNEAEFLAEKFKLKYDYCVGVGDAGDRGVYVFGERVIHSFDMMYDRGLNKIVVPTGSYSLARKLEQLHDFLDIPCPEPSLYLLTSVF